MCILAWDWNALSGTLLLIGNRDEWYARPTLGLHHWADAPILAGRDVQAGGTWLGVARGRRMAALTNVRSTAAPKTPAPSRGRLVQEFLESDATAVEHLQGLLPRTGVYNAFNLLVWDGTTVALLESRHGRIQALQQGVVALSNGDFDAPWPKTERLRLALDSALAQPEAPQDAALLALLQDNWTPPDDALPATGVPLQWERGLAPVFVQSPLYGTRCSSVLRLDTFGAQFTMRERDDQGHWSLQRHELAWAL